MTADLPLTNLPQPLRALLLETPDGIGVKALQRAAGMPATGVLTRNCVAQLAARDQRELVAAFLAERAVRLTGVRGFDRLGREWFADLFKSALDAALPK